MDLERGIKAFIIVSLIVGYLVLVVTGCSGDPLRGPIKTHKIIPETAEECKRAEHGVWFCQGSHPRFDCSCVHQQALQHALQRP